MNIILITLGSTKFIYLITEEIKHILQAGTNMGTQYN